MMKNDGSVIHFNNPKVQASLAANTFAVTGQSETKQITEMLPGILNQLGAESLQHLKRLATSVGAGQAAAAAGAEGAKTIEEEDDDDDVPDLVENFDEASKNEAKADTCCSKGKLLQPTFGNFWVANPEANYTSASLATKK